MEHKEAAKLVAVCLAMWPNHPVANLDGLIAGWEMALADLDYRDCEAALRDYLQTGTFFPAPAEIRQRVKATQPALDGRAYKRFEQLRRSLQAGELTADGAEELAAIERRLGVPVSAPAPRAMAVTR